MGHPDGENIGDARKIPVDLCCKFQRICFGHKQESHRVLVALSLPLTRSLSHGFHAERIHCFLLTMNSVEAGDHLLDLQQGQSGILLRSCSTNIANYFDQVEDGELTG